MDMFRIKAIEYCDDGSCEVVTENMVFSDSYSYKLAGHCYKPSWLEHFQQPDLETIWQLVRRQSTVSFIKRCISYCMIKFFEVRLMLRNWEDDLQRKLITLKDEFDEW